MLKALRDFLQLEAASGILLLIAAILALLSANSGIANLYAALLDTSVNVSIGQFAIHKPLLLWINDGLMAVFFFLVGLELKREVVEGELSDLKQVTLPAIGALGGMMVPALIYIAVNWGDRAALNGWAIPSATDIAFALGVLSMLGNRVPPALKIFLLTLAILDDLGAILVIALFYTSELSVDSLIVASLALIILFVLNRTGVKRISAYVLVGIVLWVSVLKSGVHATLAGVALALFIPMDGSAEEKSPLHRLENDLHPPVAYGILPLFAFANAGVSLHGLSIGSLLAPVPLGIAAGLLIGKPLGVFGFSWLAIRLGWARLPAEVNWKGLWGVAMLCGIGFTMSLFIGSLAFGDSALGYKGDDRLGILVGSLLSSIAGYLMLRWVLRRR